MARRLLVTILNALEGWDADYRDTVTALGFDDEPMTLPFESTPGSLPVIGTHDYSLITVDHADFGKVLVHDDGTAYRVIAQPFSIEVGRTIAGAQTAVDPYGVAQLTFAQTPRAFPYDIKIVTFACVFAHLNGSDPGDWTLNVRNEDTGPTTRTCTLELNAVNFPTNQVTTGKLSAVLDIAAGERLFCSYTGPSCTNPLVTTILSGIQFVPEIIT